MNFFRRLSALVKKEFLQVIRDNSSILIGAVVFEDFSPTAQKTLNFLNGSEYYAPQFVTSMHDAEILFNARKLDAILVIQPNF